MRNTFWIVGLALVVPIVASAQKAPLLEVFGGYSYLGIHGYAAQASLLFPGSGGSGGATFGLPNFGLNGWNGSAAVNATRWLGAVADVGGIYGMPTKTIGGMPVTIGVHEYNYLFGPRFSIRDGRWVTYVHALFGEAHASVRIGGPEVLAPIGIVETKFAMALGGGADVGVYRKFAVRAQADWLTTRFLGGRQQYIRVVTGLVYRL